MRPRFTDKERRQATFDLAKSIREQLVSESYHRMEVKLQEIVQYVATMDAPEDFQW